MSQSFLALLSKLQGEKCLTHVDTEGVGRVGRTGVAVRLRPSA
jgi:hypothetical protein